MAKVSTVKRKAASVPIKVPKTRLNKEMKDRLLEYMEKEFDSRIDDTELAEAYAALLSKTNAILRAKYPEEDMPILRKYGLVTTDYCLRFTILGSERVFGIRLLPVGKLQGELADIPCRGGCYSSEIFSCDKAFEELADKWTDSFEQRRVLVAEKRNEYWSFLLACRYLEDVEAVVPLRDELRKSLGGASRSLSIMSPDVISRIKSDFTPGVAA